MSNFLDARHNLVDARLCGARVCSWQHMGEEMAAIDEAGLANQGLSRMAALISGEKPRLEVTGERKSTGLCDQLDPGETRGQRDFKDGR